MIEVSALLELRTQGECIVFVFYLFFLKTIHIIAFFSTFSSKMVRVLKYSIIEPLMLSKKWEVFIENHLLNRDTFEDRISVFSGLEVCNK